MRAPQRDRARTTEGGRARGPDREAGGPPCGALSRRAVIALATAAAVLGCGSWPGPKGQVPKPRKPAAPASGEGEPGTLFRPAVPARVPRELVDTPAWFAEAGAFTLFDVTREGGGCYERLRFGRRCAVIWP